MHDNNSIFVSTMRIHAQVLNNTIPCTTDAANVLCGLFTVVATKLLKMTFIPSVRFPFGQPVHQTSGSRGSITFPAVKQHFCYVDCNIDGHV